MDCLFCKIAQHTIPAQIIYEDKHVLAFNDIAPQAPQHILIIPKQHIATLNELANHDTDNKIMGYLTQTATQLAKDTGIAEQGYRIVMNCNAEAGQTVFHIHMHLLGGRAMHWPPG